ncbi:hypothetical protein Tco_0226709, partial [Tanacetum coccineum]
SNNEYDVDVAEVVMLRSNIADVTWGLLADLFSA